MAKESINIVNLIGKIIEIESRTGLTKKGVPYIGGTVKVETSPDNIVPVGFFAQEITSKGKENPLYKSLKTVAEDFKTVQKDTREVADVIEIGGARLSENIFFPQSDRMVRSFQINGAFFNRKPNADTKNEFIVSGEILQVIEDIKNDVPAGTLTLRLLVVGYGDKANILDFKVEDPAAVKYVQSTFTEGMEVKITGSIVIDETIEEIKEEVAFGDPIIRTTRKTERKLVITSATAPVDSSISQEDKATMLATREFEIQAKKNEAAAPAQSAAKADFSL